MNNRNGLSSKLQVLSSKTIVESVSIALSVIAEFDDEAYGNKY